MISPIKTTFKSVAFIALIIASSNPNRAYAQKNNLIIKDSSNKSVMVFYGRKKIVVQSNSSRKRGRAIFTDSLIILTHIAQGMKNDSFLYQDVVTIKKNMLKQHVLTVLMVYSSSISFTLGNYFMHNSPNRSSALTRSTTLYIYGAIYTTGAVCAMVPFNKHKKYDLSKYNVYLQ